MFESGLGMSGGNFEPVFSALASTASGIAYDRNGLGKSQADTTIKSDKDVVNRLRAFLQAIKIEPPYLLVGHSLSGPLIRLYTSIFPNEVAGLVFIDAADFMLTKEEDEQVKTLSKSATGYRKLRVTMMEKCSKDTSIPLSIRDEMVRVRSVSIPSYFKE
jgi:pimeloyl-ACP methyl ester carboxylesterase